MRKGTDMTGSTGRARAGALALAVLALTPLMPAAIRAQSDDDGEFECVIQPAQVVAVASPVGGLLEIVDISRGDTVTRGQRIARLESGIEETTVALIREQAETRAEIEAFRARLTLAQSRAERLTTLVERNISPQGELEEAQAGVEVATRELAMAEMRHRIAGFELDRAEATLEQRTLTSPIDGVVLERLLSAGEYASPDLPVARIAQLDPLFVEAFLPVALFGRLTPGMDVSVRPAPPIEGLRIGRLTVLDRVFDAASGTFGIRVEIENADFGIPAGHRCRLNFRPRG